MGLEPLMSAYIADCEWRGAGGRSGDPEAAARPWKSAICSSRGMTLPEILAAIAILSILFGLLFMPLMKAFGYLHTANTAISVQNSARTLFESVTREISDAIYIYDNCDDPTLASLIVVLPQGAGTNVSQVPSTGSSVPILINPGPGLDYGVNTPVHVHYQIALTRSLERQPDGTMAPASYWNQWEMESQDLRGAGLDQIAENPRRDNLYRLVRLEYLPSAQDPTTAQPEVRPYLLRAILPSDFDPSQPDQFREPGWLVDESLFPRKPKGTGIPPLCNSVAVANRRWRLEENGLLVGLTPKEDVDVAWVTYTPPPSGSPAGTPGTWSAKPLIRFEPLAVVNEALDPVTQPGASYPATYRADYGHWQWKRRKAWSHPGYGTSSQLPAWARYFQVFSIEVRRRYGNQPAVTYYVSAGRTDSASGVPATDTSHYYVWRLTDREPVDGAWPASDQPTFDMTRYKARIEAFRQGPPSSDQQLAFWQSTNPYDTNLLPSPGGTEPYWPEMAFLADVERGSINFRVDAPVRPPVANPVTSAFEPQPPGPLAPFQAPYFGTGPDAVPAPDGERTDWLIPDVARAATSSNYRNSDGTTWIRIVPETMRVMVGQPINGDPAQGYTWSVFTRVAEGTLPGRGQFCYDENYGLLTFAEEDASLWDGNTKIRAWYQLQTNVQRAYASSPINSADGISVSASYLTKEVIRFTLGLRGYDKDTGKAHPFQLTSTIRPRNLR
jgi:prepilin-type N-terminal cleavage/methylation domain-containing protein